MSRGTTEHRAVYEFFSGVEKTEVEWLWYPYIPYGKITLLQGDPGEGKSTFMLNIAALVTRGEKMPDGYDVKEPQTVIYQCTEDDASDTIKPRLINAGADCSKVAYMVNDNNDLTLDDHRIEETIKATGARLLIMDPIQSFLAQDGDMLMVGRMRSVLTNLSKIATRYKCAVVLVGHMNKAEGGKNLYRGLGSIDIAAVARSILMITRDKDNPCRRYMIPVKSSLAEEGEGISFEFRRNKGFLWVSDDVPEPCIDNTGNKTKLESAVKAITEILAENDAEGTAIMEALNRNGFGRKTVYKAKKMAGVASYRKNNQWYWTIPRVKESD